MNTDNIIKGYITGFFDAEGCVRISNQGKLAVFITQSHFSVLEKIKMLFNGKIIPHSIEGYDNKGVHRKNSWRIYI